MLTTEGLEAGANIEEGEECEGGREDQREVGEWKGIDNYKIQGNHRFEYTLGRA